jgi:hypothetical protein
MEEAVIVPEVPPVLVAVVDAGAVGVGERVLALITLCISQYFQFSAHLS